MKKEIVIVAFAVLFFSCRKEDKTIEKTTVEQTSPAKADTGKYCYMEVTSVDSGDGKTVNDTIAIEMEVTGNNANGTFEWLPYYKDKKTGTFTGVVTNGTFKGILEARAEGTVNKEEFIFDYDENKASVKFGEMAEGKEGVWNYKDIGNTSEQVVQKAVCK